MSERKDHTMKKRLCIALVLILVLILKYFVSACPMLPNGFYSDPLYVEDLNFHYGALNDPMAKLLLWLDCYLSVPGAMPSSGQRAAGLRFGTEGSIGCIVSDGEFLGTLWFPDGDEGKTFVSIPGLGESLHYLAWDYWKAGLTEGAGG